MFLNFFLRAHARERILYGIWISTQINHKRLITLHGLPAAIQSEGMSWVTTLPAPITVRSPMVTPGQTVTLPPSQQSSPILMGKADSSVLRRWR